MATELFARNRARLAARFPALAARLDGVGPDGVAVRRAHDGGIYYRRNRQPLTDPNSPVAAAHGALQPIEGDLSDSAQPVLVAGLNPGHDLDLAYQQVRAWRARQRSGRRLYVLVHDLDCLRGWLQAGDHEQLLDDEHVEFHWHEEADAIVAACEADPERRTRFLPVSTLGPAGERMIAPLTAFHEERLARQAAMIAENNARYAALTDAELARRIAGGSDRPPRVMMPVIRNSTVLRYSARDTLGAFAALGWETDALETDQELSAWRLVEAIHRRQPDVFIWIDHLRPEAGKLLPPDMLLVTWVQDSMPTMLAPATADVWSRLARDKRRDLLAGYVSPLRGCGYPEDRLEPVAMAVDTERFRPRELAPRHLDKYACELCFASHRSQPLEVWAGEMLPRVLGACGLHRDLLLEIAGYLRDCYRADQTFITMPELDAALLGLPSAREALERLGEETREVVVERLFWHLNDIAYRHVVLDWCVELGVDLHLYGEGWAAHPRFARYAQGPVSHGEELSIAFQAAGRCLHLNSAEGAHQRFWEILACGARLLTRRRKAESIPPAFARALRRLAGYGDDEPASAAEREALARWVQTHGGAMDDAGAISRLLRGHLVESPGWFVPDWSACSFATREDLVRQLRRLPTGGKSTRRPPGARDVVRQFREAILRLLRPEAAAIYDTERLRLRLDLALPAEALRRLQTPNAELLGTLDLPGCALDLSIGRLLADEDAGDLLAAAGDHPGRDVVEGILAGAPPATLPDNLPRETAAGLLALALHHGHLDSAAAWWAAAPVPGEITPTRRLVAELHRWNLHDCTTALLGAWPPGVLTADLRSELHLARFLARAERHDFAGATVRATPLAAGDRDQVVAYRYWLSLSLDEAPGTVPTDDVAPALADLWQALDTWRDGDDPGRIDPAITAHPWWALVLAALEYQLGFQSDALDRLNTCCLDNRYVDSEAAAQLRTTWSPTVGWPMEALEDWAALVVPRTPPCSWRRRAALAVLRAAAPVGPEPATPSTWQGQGAAECRACPYRNCQCLWTQDPDD